MMKLLVVGDHPVSLSGISYNLFRSAGYEIIGVVNNGYELIRFCKREKVLPTLVLLDVQLDKIDGITTMEYMGVYFPAVKIIAISSYEDRQVITDFFAAGGSAYVYKDRLLDKLHEALTAVASNKEYVDSRLFFDLSQRDKLVELRASEKEYLFAEFRISMREKEILALIVSQLDYREIGEILSLSPKTIENTVGHLTKKFGLINGRAGLLLHSLRLGLTKMIHLRGLKVKTV